MDIAEQIVVIFCGVRGYSYKIEPTKINDFEDAFVAHALKSLQINRHNKVSQILSYSAKYAFWLVFFLEGSSKFFVTPLKRSASAPFDVYNARCSIFCMGVSQLFVIII